MAVMTKFDKNLRAKYATKMKILIQPPPYGLPLSSDAHIEGIENFVDGVCKWSEVRVPLNDFVRVFNRSKSFLQYFKKLIASTPIVRNSSNYDGSEIEFQLILNSPRIYKFIAENMTKYLNPSLLFGQYLHFNL